MSEYIDRNEAKTVFCSDCSDGMHRICKQDGGCGVYKRFCAIPIADVAQVVRCKDCKHWDGAHDINPERKGKYLCLLTALFTKYTWFCADGEKRDEPTCDGDSCPIHFKDDNRTD